MAKPGVPILALPAKQIDRKLYILDKILLVDPTLFCRRQHCPLLASTPPHLVVATSRLLLTSTPRRSVVASPWKRLATARIQVAFTLRHQLASRPLRLEASTARHPMAYTSRCLVASTPCPVVSCTSHHLVASTRRLLVLGLLSTWCPLLCATWLHPLLIAWQLLLLDTWCFYASSPGGRTPQHVVTSTPRHLVAMPLAFW